MKKVFKNILVFSTILCMLISAMNIGIQAAPFDGSSVLAFNTQPIKVGDIITIKANFSATEKMEILQGFLTYNVKVLEYVGKESNLNEITKGRIKIYTDNVPNGKTHTESFKFKAIATGASAIALEDIRFWSMDEIEHMIEGAAGVSVTVVDTSAQASSNANLKALSVSTGTLTPKFNPEVTEYSLTIPNDVTELWVSTTKADSKATTSVEGSRNMKVGLNKRVVVVTAENGTVKKYTINITRLAADGQTPEVDPTPEDEGLNNLSEVIVGDQKMYVVEDFTGAELPQGFSVIEYAFDGKTIPALSDEAYVLLMLRLPDNSASGLYIYSKDGEFTPLITINVGAQNYYVLPAEKAPAGFTAVKDFAIGEISVPAYKSDKTGFEDYVLVYAKGPSGKNSFYVYDTVEQTIQRVSGLAIETKTEEDQTISDDSQSADILTNFVELNTNGKIVVITILAIILLLITAVIVLIVKIATAGKDDEDIDYDEEIEDEDQDDNSSIVGFEFISVSNAEETTEETAEETTEEVVEENDETPEE